MNVDIRRTRRLRLLAAVAALTTGAVLVSNATAAGTGDTSSSAASIGLLNGGPSVTAPVTLTAEGVAVHYPVLATGFTSASLSATLSVPAGTGMFSFATTSGITALFGYPSTGGEPTSGPEVGFFGNLEAVVDVLANHIRWTGDATGDVTVSVSVNAYADGLAFNPDNGHYYEEVASGSPVTWINASNSAATRTKFGMTGYLVTITSASENSFIASKVDAQNVWIGASDEAVEETWRWMTGPEAGTHFWQGYGNGSTVSGSFAAWATGEPNGPAEDCAVTNWQNVPGRWNDLACDSASVSRYLVEYGPPSGGVEAVSLSVPSAVVAPVVLTVVPNADGEIVSLDELIECGVTCSAQYVPGTSVTLTAVPVSGKRLASWGGACSGAGTCVLNMSSAVTVSATFELIPTLPPQLPGLVTQPVLTTPPSTVAPSTTTPGTTQPPATTTPPTTAAPSPVPADASGALPSLQPGESAVTENGVTTPVQVVVENATDLVLRGDGFELRLAGECAAECTVRTDASGRQVIELESNGAARVAGSGFLPGTPVYVWLFSTPTFLGELTVNTDGSFTGFVPLFGVETGTHTLQVNGTSFDGKPRTANLGVVVTPAAVPSPGVLPATGTNNSNMVIWGWALLAGGALLLATRRRNHTSI